jgi:hypothetical protein
MGDAMSRTRAATLVLLGLAALVLNPVCGQSPPYYTFAAFDVPGAFETQVWGINDAGEIVGGYTDRAHFSHGFVMRDGEFTTIDYPGPMPTTATGINNSGLIVGSFVDLGAGSEFFGFTAWNGKFTRTGYSNSTGTWFNSVNNRQDIAGYSYLPDQSTPYNFLFSQGQFTPINLPLAAPYYVAGLNDLGDLTVVSSASGFLCHQGRVLATINFPGANYTSPTGVNNRREIVGQWGTYDGLARGFLSLGRSLVSIIPFGSHYTGAAAINNSGVIVGYFEDASGKLHGYIATPNIIPRTPLPRS